MTTEETPGQFAVNAATELAEQSNEQLLHRLAQSVESRRRYRNKQKVVYGAYYLICILVAVSMIFVPLFSRLPMFALGMQIPFFVFVVVFMAFINWLNRSFYRRTAQQRDSTVLELARRGEERALGPLLELMDMRMSVSSNNWGVSRPVFIEALGLLLACITPASFADLSDAQIHQLTPLMLLPEPELRASISETLCRSGDARALRSLRKYEGMYRVQRLQKLNPAVPLMLAWLRKRKMPALDKEAIMEVKRCCEAIEPRVEAEKRMAQLLRASESSAESPSNQLLRGAMPAAMAEPADQLLRPGTTASADAAETRTAEMELTSAVGFSAPPAPIVAQGQTAELEEVQVTRG